MTLPQHAHCKVPLEPARLLVCHRLFTVR